MATQQFSTLPPMNHNQDHGHYAAQNAPSAPTLPSIGSLISGADMMTPAAPNVAYNHHNHYHTLESPTQSYRSNLPQTYGLPTSATRPVTGYSANESSVSPATTGPESYRRSSMAFKDRYSNPQLEHAQYPAAASPRRSSFAHPASTWPTQIPQNYTFTAQPSASNVATSYTTQTPYLGHLSHPTAPSPRFGPHQAQQPQQVSASYWKPDNAEMESKPQVSQPQPRHLIDEFDLIDTLNQIKEHNKNIGDFATHYSERAQTTSRTGPLPGSTPNLMEIERMIQHQNDVQYNLFRMRDVIAEQQAILAEHSREQMHKHTLAASPENTHMHDPQDSHQSDNKKRRGRAAPPGRCHSCARSETPEWRRGPDGARTLCNACGLHYAKLTRKLGAKAAAAIPLSALRRSIEGGSSAF